MYDSCEIKHSEGLPSLPLKFTIQGSKASQGWCSQIIEFQLFSYVDSRPFDIHHAHT